MGRLQSRGFSFAGALSSFFKTSQGSLTVCGLSAVVVLGIPLCSACFCGRKSQVSTLLHDYTLLQGTGGKYGHARNKGLEHYGVSLQFLFSLEGFGKLFELFGSHPYLPGAQVSTGAPRPLPWWARQGVDGFGKTPSPKEKI